MLKIRMQANKKTLTKTTQKNDVLVENKFKKMRLSQSILGDQLQKLKRL